MTLLHDGRACIKYPADLDVYTRIIKESKPEVIVETGSWEGGSAAWFSQYAEVISVDWYAPEPLNRVTFIQGNTVDPSIVTQVEALVAGRACLVTLDSDHNAPHVLKELESYAPLATTWLVVEDTFVDRDHVPGYPLGGPGTALDQWLPLHPEWIQAREYEAKGSTQNPGGWLCRTHNQHGA